LANPAERDLLLAYLEDRFGIERGEFEGFLFFRKKKSWWICRNTTLLVSVSHLKISRMGMKAFQKVGQFLKPSTRFIQMFGCSATRAALVISEAQLLRILEGKHLPLDLDVDQGYVILRLDEKQVVGLGLYVKGSVRCQISRKALKSAMIGGEK
jgi:NOL1/NOP2/fmu family ribosome biogenesis protein